jgi:zinc protease
MGKGITRQVLANGFTALLRPEMSYPVVSIQLWVKVGSINEEDPVSGVSHFVEHLLFKGTKDKSSAEINRIIEGSGGEINAYTSFEQTAYHIVITSRYWEKGLEVVADMVQNSTFLAEGIEAERKVILEEIKEGEDSPEVLLSQQLFSDCYTVQQYRRPVIGYRETVSKMTRDQIIKHFTDYYVPNNMILAVAGNFDLSLMKRKIAQLFGSAKFRQVPGLILQTEPPQATFKYSTLSKGESETVIEMAFPIPSAFHSDTVPLDLLSIILGEGEGSRLNQEAVTQKGIAREAGTHTFTPIGSGLFLLRVVPFKGKFSKSIEEVLSHVWRIAREGVTQEEIDRARANIEKDLIFMEETVYGKAKKLAYYESSFGDYSYEKNYLKSLRWIKKSDIKRIAQAYFKPRSLTMVVLYPKENEDENGKRIEKIVTRDEMLKIVAGSLPKKRKVPKSDRIKKKQLSHRIFTEHRLKNGLKVILKNNKSSPLLTLAVVGPGGVRGETIENNGITGLISNLIQKGTRNRSYKQISYDITMLGGYVETFVGRNTFGLKMDALCKNIDGVIDLFLDLLLHPVFSVEHLKQEKQRALEELLTLKDNFDAYGYSEFLTAMYGKHPYSYLSIGTEKSLAKIDRKSIVEYYSKLLDPKNLTLAIVGSFDEKDILGKMEKSLGKLETRISNDFKKMPVPKLSSPVDVERKIDSNNAYIHIGFRGATLGSEDKYALEVLNAALSNFGDGKLYMHLREKLALAYSVYSVIFHGIDDGYLMMYMNTGPDNTELAIREMRKIVEDLHKEGIDDKVLERVKNYIAGSYEIDLQRNSSQAINLALNRLYNLPLAFDDYTNSIMKVDRAAVQRVIDKYLDLSRSVQVVLKP